MQNYILFHQIIKFDFLENLIDELDLRRKIKVLHYTENISHYF